MLRRAIDLVFLSMKLNILKNKFVFFVSCLLIVIQIGCSLDNDYKVIPNKDLSSSNINSEIGIFAPVELNTYRFNDPVTIIIENFGKTPIFFLNDFDICLFINDSDNWVEIRSVKTVYLEGDILLLPTEKDPLKYGTTMIEPILENYSIPVKIRIAIIGYKFIDGVKTDQLVAAYTDIWLFPKE